MKVFNLACEHDHSFEGWFGSSDDYDTQVARGLLECPVCASRSIRKLLSAPRLNLSHAQPPAPRAGADAQRASTPAAASTGGLAPDPRAVQEMLFKMARAIVENTEDVGDKFADEARKIHYQEAPERAIRGVATEQDARELAEEGIDVMAFPIPLSSKEPLQ